MRQRIFIILIVLSILLVRIPQPVRAQSNGLISATAIDILDPSHWIWPLTPELTNELHSIMDSVISDAKARYGAGPAKVIILENSTSLLNDFASKSQQAFPNALVVGVGPGNANYNAFTEGVFAEHGERSVALLALGGNDITQVLASGQKSVGQGSIADLQIAAGELIAMDLKSHVSPTKSNLIIFFGPGHNPNHKLVLCGFKQGFAGISNQCNPNNPSNPESTSLPPLPSYLHIIGSSGYYGANTVVGTNVVSQTVMGTLIQGNFRLAAAGLAGTPNATNIVSPINQVTNELGGPPNHLFLSPGHPSVGNYEALRQKMVTLLPSTTIFGHEGGGETGHIQTSSPGVAVIEHLFMIGLRSSGGSGQVVQGDYDNDGDCDINDYTKVVNLFSNPYTIYDYNNVVSNFGS